jgi:serine/threonine protein kinase
MRSSQESRDTCGQITAYATSHMSAQYRTHVFFVLICGDYARLIRWDRSGAIVTQPIFYDEVPDLVDFFIRFNLSPADVRGHDTTVRVAKCEDTKDAVKVIKEFEELAKSRSLLVASVPNPTTGESLEYVIAPPSASPWAPVGRWTRTSIGYDIQRKRSVFMKDSWRLVIEGVPKEGDVYSKFKANAVPNVPHCSNSGDIGEDTYHLTRTDQFVNQNWNPKYAYDFTPHRHYRLILDDIGQPLNSFKCSRDMVRAVCAALIGRFFFDGVEVYFSEPYTPVAHESAYKCGILHRDISPGNILITSDNNFDGGLLIDWDLCKDINLQGDKPRRAARTVSFKIRHTLGTHELDLGHLAVHGR